MRDPRPVSATADSGSSEQGRDARGQAAQGPVPDPVSAAANPAPAPAPAQIADTAQEAHGRRILSTAFVMIGPDGHLTVERRDGRVLVLRDVAMHRKDYCGRAVLGGTPGSRYCGTYAEVAAARPGGAPALDQPASAAANPIEPKRR